MSRASISHARTSDEAGAVAPSGASSTVTSQATGRDAPAGRSIVCAARAIGALGGGRAVDVLGALGALGEGAKRAPTATRIARVVVLRNVAWAVKRSPSRTRGGRPPMICRSCVVWIMVSPVPNRSVPASATATMRKLPSVSLSGTVTTARPSASSTTAGFHSSRVSNSSRVRALPPPPPAGTALRP